VERSGGEPSEYREIMGSSSWSKEGGGGMI
jgi:hypothetical protein